MSILLMSKQIGNKRKVDSILNNVYSSTCVKRLHTRWRPIKMRWRLRIMVKKYICLCKIRLKKNVLIHYKKSRQRAKKNWRRAFKGVIKHIRKKKSRIIRNWATIVRKKIKKRKTYEAGLLKAPTASTKVKGRDGSTRNGLVVSYSYYHRPSLTIEEIEHRNHLLNVNENTCFWCKSKPKEALDHAHPACSTATSSYSWTNAMNIFPSCNQCNTTKGGTPLNEWLFRLESNSCWTREQIYTFRTWLANNKTKLLFDKKDTEYVEKQFETINAFHKLAEHCAKNKLDLSDFVKITVCN